MKYFLKVVVLGDFSVGKTSIIQRYVENRFPASYIRTIGTDLYSKEIKNPKENIVITFQIWDFSGDVEFKRFRQEWYQAALGGILVADLSRPESIESLNNWVAECQENALPSFQIVFAANKLDLISENLSHPHVKLFNKITEEWQHECHFVSAKTGNGIENLFLTLFNNVMEQ